MKCDFQSCEAFIDRHGWLCKCMPMVFVLLLVGTTYYAYVVELCIMYIPEVDVKVAYLIFFHLTLAIFSVSYSAAKLAPFIDIPPDFRLTKDEFTEIREALFREDRLSVQAVLRRRVEQFDLPICTRTDSGEVRFCMSCALIKPDRAHHCSSCNRCILRMDHHCIWIGTCVGFHNHKQFILFLLYTLIFAIFVAATSTSNAYAIIYGGPESKFRTPSGANGTAVFPLNDVMSRPSIVAVVLLPVFSIAIGIGVTLLGVFQIWLVSKNRTGLEQLKKPMLENGQTCKAPFDTKSCAANWISLFGSRRLLWFVPVFSSELDGIIYPTALNGSSRTSYRRIPDCEEAATAFV